VVLPDDVTRVLGADAGIQRIELTGSRASGRATPQSDWDFRIVTAAFDQVREAMPRLVVPLRPVVAQWDRLSRTWCYMLILPGPAKVDLIFGQPHSALPPWQAGASTLRGIDDHFWDWTLWLRSKQAAGQQDLVEAELGKLHEHLLGPLGVLAAPATIELAVAGYRTARHQWEQRLGMRIPRAAEEAVIQVVHPWCSACGPARLSRRGRPL
jgi:hypothetical protein